MADTKRTFDAMLGRLQEAKPMANGWHRALCPCHDDHDASLNLTLSDDGAIVFKCHAGCEKTALLQWFGLTWADLFPDKANGQPPRPAKPGRVVATYDYTDEAGALLYQATRHEPKDFRLRRPDGSNGWIWELGDTRRVLYHLPELTTVQPGQLVFVCEGEKTADAVRGLGAVATTNPMGVGKWTGAYTGTLEGLTVVVLADNDPPGLKHAYQVAAALHGRAYRVQVLNLGEGKGHGYDPADWIRDGGAWAGLVQLVDATPVYSGERAPVLPAGGNIHNTDLGNALRLVGRYGNDLRYCKPLGGWLAWDGRRWLLDRTGVVQRAAQAVALALYAALDEEADPKRRKEKTKWAIASESGTRQREMLDLAWSQEGIIVTPDVFDTPPWLLNCQNGTIDLHTGELRPHRRADLLTKLAPVEYDPLAEDETLASYLQDTTKGDEDFADYLRRAVGYTLTGVTDEEDVFLVLGPKSTGKTTLVEAMLAMLGDYAVKANFETFLASWHKGGDPRPDLVRMRGARLVAATEAPKGRRLAETQVKEMSGGDSMTARTLYKLEITFKPAFKLWLACNEAPAMSDDDSGLWRRIKRLPFEHTHSEEEEKPEIKRHLTEDAGARSALLAWAMQGCLAWQKDGLKPCEVVRTKTAQLRLEFDPLAEFFGDRCTFAAKQECAAQVLRAAYERWAEDQGAKAISNKEWGKRLKAKECVSTRERQKDAKTGEDVKRTIWHGVGLLSDDDEPPEAEPEQAPLLFLQ